MSIMLKNDIAKVVSQITALGEGEFSVEVPTDEAFGDYSTNAAFKLEGSPRENAEKIVGKLSEVDSLMHFVSQIEIAGPGFINFKLSKDFLVDTLSQIVKAGEKYGSFNLGNGKTVIVEYSSPNIAKGFGVGHLRSTIIGQSLVNVYKKLGYEVVGENHLGDWGTQFGMVLAQINKKGLNASSLSVEELEKLYVDFNAEMDSDPSLRDEAKEWFKKIEEGDGKARAQWEAIKETSLKEFDRLYELLGVKIDNTHGESFYEDMMTSVIDDFRSEGLTKMSEGAEIVEFKDLPPALLVKSDGTTTYFTRDLAAIKYRSETWNPLKIIYEVGADQTLHFRQVFEAAKMFDWGKKIHYVHLAHGMIRLPEGKMSTRKGRTVKLESVLDESIRRAEEIIARSDTNRGLSGSERHDLARQVGVGAVKYYDLMHTPESEIVFDWDKMFVLTGNSGPYLQYTYARIQSLIEKVEYKDENADIVFSTQSTQLTNEEVGVMRHLVHYPEVVEIVGKMYSPNLLANYLYELASKFNTFYNANKIVGGENEAFRISLSFATASVIKDGLGLLGIEAPSKM